MVVTVTDWMSRAEKGRYEGEYKKKEQFITYSTGAVSFGRTPLLSWKGEGRAVTVEKEGKLKGELHLHG